jgi:septal ring factor EnvC (AmiA/AmiB activator)
LSDASEVEEIKHIVTCNDGHGCRKLLAYVQRRYTELEKDYNELDGRLIELQGEYEALEKERDELATAQASSLYAVYAKEDELDATKERLRAAMAKIAKLEGHQGTPKFVADMPVIEVSTGSASTKPLLGDKEATGLGLPTSVLPKAHDT